MTSCISRLRSYIFILGITMQRPHVVVPALDSFVLVQKFKYRPVYH